MARPDHRQAADLVQRRLARRQPGSGRADGRGAQDAHVPDAGRDRLQGDRGRLSRRLADRLRLRAPADRAEHDPPGRDDPGADPGARGVDRPHLRRAAGRAARDRASLQFDLDAPAARRVRPGPPGNRRHRRPGRRAREAQRRRHARQQDRLPVFARKLHRHRARFRARHLRGGDRGLPSDATRQDDHQPAGDGGNGDAQRLCRPDRMVPPQLPAPRLLRPQPASAQRPRHGRGGGRTGSDGRRRADRGHAVRKRRAHGQCLPGHSGAQSLHPGRGSGPRLLGYRFDPAHRRILQPDSGPSAPSLWRRPGVHRLLRLAPRCHQEGFRSPEDQQQQALGGSLSADRPSRSRPQLRGDHPHQQPERQGRHRLSAEDRSRSRPAAPAADRVLPDHPAHRRRDGQGGRFRPDLVDVPVGVPGP